MLAGPVKPDRSWKIRKDQGGVHYSGPHATVGVEVDPWRVSIRDSAGKLLTRTRHLADTACFFNSHPVPFMHARKPEDFGRHIAASFILSPGERIYGCGESFTRLDKRGQKVVLWTHDAQGVQNDRMYKPIPFFMSSMGYGMFVHGTTPMTFDFGKTYDETTVLYSGDDQLDLFIFTGSPKEILAEYTTLTGRTPMPPLWSFGLWMSRITYKSEKETREVAANLRRHRIPSDVIHLDTGWFEHDWQCDYRFAPGRFRNPRKMIADLKKKGFRICLWQLPYFIKQNMWYPEIVKKGLAVRRDDGAVFSDEAVLDFSNPATVKWYQGKLAGLLRLGVAAIKVDFGEGAPLAGRYASGRTGFYEHNYYPLRYNKAAAEVTKKITGDWIIWARSTWAGSQRYPLHWGGDAENTDSAMAATLRGGLSLGLCGFSFWSHDIGGFVKPAPAELYARWMPFGMLTSHSRCHGAPPKEPWPYGKEFMDSFRRSVELKYRLMPYVYAQSKDSSVRGLPMLRALFVEYPDDPGSWLVEDEYLFGRDILVCPLFDSTGRRKVYLPPGGWVDYQTGEKFTGPGFVSMVAAAIPAVILVRENAVIPHAEAAQSTDLIDWRRLELVAFGSDPEGCLVCLPADGRLHTVSVGDRAGRLAVTRDPFRGRIRWQVRRA
jgi:alpha-D-xyloside xylohydrolase